MVISWRADSVCNVVRSGTPMNRINREHFQGNTQCFSSVYLVFGFRPFIAAPHPSQVSTVTCPCLQVVHKVCMSILVCIIWCLSLGIFSRNNVLVFSIYSFIYFISLINAGTHIHIVTAADDQWLSFERNHNSFNQKRKRIKEKKQTNKKQYDFPFFK